jgi:thiosulfate/3-mercaptopyruvate sulfurtransferase
MLYQTIVSAATLAENLENPAWVTIDCRFRLNDPAFGRNAYANGHIPGAFYAHLDEDLSGKIISGHTGRHPLPEPDALAALFSSWGISSGVQVVGYDDMGGAMAARLWWLLRWLGHPEVAILDGGITHWEAEGRPLSQETPSFRNARFIPHLQNNLVADAETVSQMRLDPDYVVVDSRAPERYRGEFEPIDPVAGHIPGAVNLPHTSNIGPDGRFLPQETIRENFIRVMEGRDGRHCTFYCGSGVTAAHNLLAMAYAGLPGGRLYPGSWSEWITDPERPVSRS